MPRLFLSEGEDLLARFHPHPVSYWPRYLLDALWSFYGFLTFYTALKGTAPEVLRFDLAYLLFPGLALGHLVVVRALRKPGWVQAAMWTVAGLLLAFLLSNGEIGAQAGSLSFLLLGLLATFINALRSEFVRTRRFTQITTLRVVLRSGVSRITERTIDLGDVKAVRAEQTPLGQAFGYGTLTLVLDAPRRQKTKAEVLEVLDAVPGYDEVKHHLETAMQELKMPKRDREKRTEDRRLKESMRALAGWVREPPQT